MEENQMGKEAAQKEYNAMYNVVLYKEFSMKKVISNFKTMSLFQKFQVLSGVFPLFSLIFVAIISYIATCKTKEWLLYAGVSAVYFVVMCLVLYSNLHFALKYLAWCSISIIGNYILVSSTQASK